MPVHVYTENGETKFQFTGKDKQLQTDLNIEEVENDNEKPCGIQSTTDKS